MSSTVVQELLEDILSLVIPPPSPDIPLPFCLLPSQSTARRELQIGLSTESVLPALILLKHTSSSSSETEEEILSPRASPLSQIYSSDTMEEEEEDDEEEEEEFMERLDNQYNRDDKGDKTP